MPASRTFITRFLQLVAERKFAEAERMLERSKARTRKNEWNLGYFQALSGILLAQKSNDDKYLFLPTMNPTNEEELKNYQRDFQEHTKNVIHADYDRGFFSAWSDYTKVLLKLNHGKKQKKTEERQEEKPAQEAPKVEITPRKSVQARLV